jgi:hypothetical protein
MGIENLKNGTPIYGGCFWVLPKYGKLGLSTFTQCFFWGIYPESIHRLWMLENRIKPQMRMIRF